MSDFVEEKNKKEDSCEQLSESLICGSYMPSDGDELKVNTRIARVYDGSLHGDSSDDEIEDAQDKESENNDEVEYGDFEYAPLGDENEHVNNSAGNETAILVQETETVVADAFERHRCEEFTYQLQEFSPRIKPLSKGKCNATVYFWSHATTSMLEKIAEIRAVMSKLNLIERRGAGLNFLSF